MVISFIEKRMDGLCSNHTCICDEKSINIMDYVLGNSEEEIEMILIGV